MIETSEIHKRLIDGANLTTAELIYHMPDNPHILQSYIWQDYDIAPDFPALMKFVTFWKDEIEGPLHSIILAEKKIITASDLHYFAGEYILH